MGRLAAKRKLKACDPFCKRKALPETNSKHDFAPVLKTSKRKKKIQNRGINQASIDKFVLGPCLSASTSTLRVPEFEGKKKDESMKEFHDRLRSDVRTVLKEENKKASSKHEKRQRYVLVMKNMNENLM